MIRRIPQHRDEARERLLANLAVRAHDVALRYRTTESFVELQLALWHALRDVLSGAESAALDPVSNPIDDESIADTSERGSACCFELSTAW